MSGLYFPQGFVTGVLQTHSRKYKIPIDTLTFKFKVMTILDPTVVQSGPKDGVYIHGLYLDGAKWDIKNDTLDDQELGILYNQLPMIHFQPTEIP